MSTPHPAPLSTSDPSAPLPLSGTTPQPSADVSTPAHSVVETDGQPPILPSTVELPPSNTVDSDPEDHEPVHDGGSEEEEEAFP